MLKLRVKQVIQESKIHDTIHDTRQHKKAKSTRHSARDLQNLHILPETLVEGLKSRRGHYWNYVVSAFENTPKNLVVHGRAKQPNQRVLLELCHRSRDILEKGTKLDRIIQLNCEEVRTHTSYKTTRT